MTDQKNLGSGKESSTNNGAVSFSSPDFNEAEAIASLKGALPSRKVQQTEQAAQTAVKSVQSFNPSLVEDAALRTEVELGNISTVEADLIRDLSKNVDIAQGVQEAVRREKGADILGSLGAGGVRLGAQIVNLPSTAELALRIGSLTADEQKTISDFQSYEIQTKQLDEAMSNLVERTDLDPITREMMRGQLQVERDKLSVPEAFDKPRRWDENFIGDPRRNALTVRTLREEYDEILSEIADTEAVDKAAEEFKPEVDSIFKEDFQKANLENTKEGLTQLSEGAEQFEQGDYLKGATNVVGGALRSLGGSFQAAWDNPEATFEILAETAPQMAAAFNPYAAALSNSAYTGDVFKEALHVYAEENDGAIPDGEAYSRMALASLGAGLLEVAADKVLVGGTGKLKEGTDPAIKAAIAGAKDSTYITKAITNLGTRAGASFVSEGATEAGQTALESVAKGEEVDGAEVSSAAAIGAIAGGGTTATAITTKEAAKGALKGADLVQEVATQAADHLKSSPEERAIRDVRKITKKKNPTKQEKVEVAKAKGSLEREESILNLLRSTPGVSPEVVAAQEKKVANLNTRGSFLKDIKPDESKFESVPEDQSVEEYLDEVSYQVSLDEGDMAPETIQKAIDNAVSKGATDEQVSDLVKIVEAKKSSADVSDNIRIGDSEWRGGGTYLQNIYNAQTTGDEVSAAYNFSELTRFVGHMDVKYDRFKKAQAEAKKLGHSVLVIDPKASAGTDVEVPYMSLDGNPMYATGDARTDALLNTMNQDKQILSGIWNDAADMYAGVTDATPESVMAQYVPVETEATAEPETVEQDTTEEVVEPTTSEPSIGANTQFVEQELAPVVEERVKRKKVDIESLPESGDIVARAANSTQSPGVKRAVRELGKQIRLKEEYGTVTEPLDSTISEKHYTLALEAIKSAMADKTFGTQLKTKGAAQEQLEATSDLYFLPDEDVDSQYRAKNEFREEAKVDGWVANTGITRKEVFARGMELGLKQDKATLVAKISAFSIQNVAPMMTKQFNSVMDKARTKNPEFMKFNTNYLSNFAGADGGLLPFMLKGATYAAVDHVMNNAKLGEAPTTSMVKAFGNLDEKSEVPPKLMALANEIGIGDNRETLVESLGTNAMNVAGVKFKGTHANTRPRHISAIGKMMLDALMGAGIITSKKVSINRLAWAGADYDTKGLLESLEARAVREKKSFKEVDNWPKKFQGDYIAYNGIAYAWTGKNYKVFDDVSQGDYLETYYINPEADFGGLTVESFLGSVKGASTPFSKVFSTDYLKKVPAMHTPRKNEGKIKGYAHKKLNKKQKAAQDKQSEQKLYLDKGIMKIKADFGDARMMRIAGYENFDEELTNKIVKLSKQGKNQTIQADMDGLNKFIEDMSVEAETTDVADYTDVPFFANFFNSGYQRQFVDSQTFNYQSSKSMHRFMAHHGEQTFTLNDVGQKVAFLVSVAQGMGISADKLSSTSSIKKLEELMDEEASVVGLMQKYLRNEDIGEAGMDEIAEFAASEENTHTLLALREYAAYRNALEDEQTEMKVVMPIELDGVNNGPITAILQSLTADSDFDAYLRRAGITLASRDTRTAAERYEDKADGLYEEGAAAVQEAMVSVSQALKETNAETDLMVLRAQTQLKALVPKNVSWGKQLEIKRNETKGIITKLFYNAGDKSLLRAEVGEIEANFYQELQKVIDGDSKTKLENLMMLMAQAATQIKKDQWTPALTLPEYKAQVSQNYQHLMGMVSTPEDMLQFELPPEALAGLHANMQLDSSFGRIKLDAIKDTYADAIHQSKVVTRMTSIAGVFARDTIKRAFDAKREELGLSQFEELSEKDIEQIYSELGDQLPNLKLDMHTAEDMSDAIPLYTMGRPDLKAVDRKRYGLTNSATTPVYVTAHEVQDVGAGGVAASTISVADASTIFGIMEQLNEGFMTVFDGVLINGLRMDVLAQAANVSYITSLRNNNTFSQIRNNFASIVARGNDTLAPEFKEELEQLAGKVDAETYVSNVEAEAYYVDTGIRKNAALGTADLSVDQFGAVNDKTSIISSDNKANDAFPELTPLSVNEEYYANVESNHPLDAPIITKTSNDSALGGFISRNWNRPARLSSSGSKKRLYNLVKQAGVENSEFAEFLRSGLIDNVLAPAFDTIGEFPSIQIVDGVGMSEAVGRSKAKGAYVWATNTIYLNTDRQGVNAETLFHELVHAALDVVLTQKGRTSKKFAEDITILAQEAAAHIQKNSGLVTRFTDLGATTDINNTVIPWINKNGDVNVREFFSWSLTNFNIITQLSQAKAESNPRGLFGRIFNLIRRVLNKLLINKQPIVEDSIFSFLFTTAADLAPNARTTQKRGKSLQEEFTDINNADPSTTFDDLMQGSNVNRAQRARLNTLFKEEILPLFNATKYEFLNSTANTAERLNELKQDGADVRLDNFRGAFQMSPVEEHTFQLYRVIMAEALESNHTFAKELGELYRSAKKQLKPSDFGQDGQAKYDALFIKHATPKAKLETSAAGLEQVYSRSEYLASFVALARTNQEVSDALDVYFTRSASKKHNRSDFDTMAIERGLELAGKVLDIRTGTAGSRKINARVENLSKKLAVVDQTSKSWIERKAQKAFEKLDYGYGLYKKVWDKALTGIFQNMISRKIGGMASEYGSGLYAAFNNRDRRALDEIHQSLKHGVMAWLPRMVEDLKSTNDHNRAFRRLSIGKTRAIAGARDGKTKATKQVLSDLLGNLTERQERALASTLLDSDMRTITESGVFSREEVLEMLRNPAKLEAGIETLQDMLYGNSQNYGHFHVRSAFSLGTLVGAGQPSEKFTLPNAKLIANFRKGDVQADFETAVAEDLVDQLATLVALSHQGQIDREMTAEILSDQVKYDKLNAMLQMFYFDSIDHRYNGNENLPMKGGFQETYNGYKDLKVVSSEDLNKLTSSNYTLVRELEKDEADGNSERLYLVVSNTGGLGAYQQGLYSTIIAAQSGIKNLDGRVTYDGYDSYSKMQHGSRVTRVKKMADMEDMFWARTPTREPSNHLVAVVNDNGVPTGFQYTLSRKERESLLGRDKTFTDALANSFGRTVEAEGTADFNQEINNKLKEAFQAAQAKGKTDSFIEVSRKAPTKRGREAYRMMPPAAREHLHRTWGEKAYVDSSLFDVVYGYRKASIANVLRKNIEDDDRSMWVKQLGRAITANYKLEKHLVPMVLHGERIATEISGTIKDLIVIRGLNVMIGNMVSNTIQLVLQEDMPLRTAMRYQLEGIREARRYQTMRAKVRRLEFEVEIEPDSGKKAKMQSRIVELNEELAKNPARQLIDHGLLTAIVEDVEEDTNPFSYMNKLGSRVTGLTDNLPEGVKWATSFAVVNKDSEVYRSLYMFTQLGDFSSRYAAFKYRMEKANKTGDQVTENDIDEIVDAFVNYDLPSNKYLQYLGDVGQLWFFKYFFRIQNVIIRNSIRNPRRVFDLLALTSITGVDISTYFDAFFLFNSITNKMGFFNYAELGWESLPVVQAYDFVS